MRVVLLELRRRWRVVASALRYQWSVLPLALAAVVLLVLGGVLSLSTPAATAMVGAGAALAGAAATRAIDLEKDRRAEAARRRQDLDETRRLAYMVLADRRGVEHYELAATFVNAISHHMRALDPETSMTNVIKIMQGNQDESWLLALITRINLDIDDL